MGFKKRYNRSERAALLALAELFKAGFIGPELLDYSLVVLGDPETISYHGSFWINRYIHFHSSDGKVIVLVRTPTGQGYSHKHSDEHVEWHPDQADVFYGTKSFHVQRKLTPVPHWSS